MSLIPRWKYMTDSSKAIVKNVVGTALVLFIGLILLRALFGWIVFALTIWGETLRAGRWGPFRLFFMPSRTKPFV